MSISIRESCVEDAASIARVHIASWKVAYKGIVHQSYLDDSPQLDLKLRTERWTENLQKGRSGQYKNYVAEQNGQIVGFADIGDPRDENMEEHAEIYAIYLDPNHYRQGIGSKLLQTIKSQALDFGYKKLYVWVFEQNKQGRDFYERMGGVLVKNGTKEIMIEDYPYIEMKYHWENLT